MLVYNNEIFSPFHYIIAEVSCVLIPVTGKKPLSQSVLNAVVIVGGKFVGDVYNFSYFSWGIVAKNIISNIMFLVFYSHRRVQVLILLVSPRVFHMYRFTTCKNKCVINVGYLQAVC